MIVDSISRDPAVGRASWRQRVLILVGLLAASSCGGEGPIQPPPVPQLTITCPAGVEGQSADGQPVSVNFSSPTTTGGVAPVTLACTPASGSLFPGGTTNVACTATDSRAAVANCTVRVFVRVPPRLLGTGRVLAFGDSITAGTEGGGTLVPGAVDGSTETLFAYPRVLDTLLVDRYRLQTPIVFARGVPAEFAQGGVLRLPGALAQSRPDILLLMEGTNDLLFGVAGVNDATVAIRSMVQMAKAANVRVLLSTIIPQRAGGLRVPPRDPYAALVPVLNARIRDIATSENVPLVDMFDVFNRDMTLIGTDDVHPTPRGFRIMAETFLEAIKLHGEQPQPAIGLTR